MAAEVLRYLRVCLTGCSRPPTFICVSLVIFICSAPFPTLVLNKIMPKQLCNALFLTVDHHPLRPGHLVLHGGHLAGVLARHVRARAGQIERAVASERGRAHLVVEVQLAAEKAKTLKGHILKNCVPWYLNSGLITSFCSKKT